MATGKSDRILLMCGALAACLGFFAVRFTQRTPYQGNSHVRRGDSIPSVSGRDAKGESVSLTDAPLNFITYLNIQHPRNTQYAIYASYLSQRMDRSKAKVIIVTGGAYPDLVHMSESGEIKIPIINDASSEIAKVLHLSRDSNASFVIDNSGRVLMGVPTVFSPEDLRELYQSYALGHVDYFENANAMPATVGTLLPELTIRDLFTGKPASLHELMVARGAKRVWFFVAECPVCSIDSFLGELKTRLGTDHELISVFSSRLPAPTLRAEAEQRQMRDNMYVATSEITGFEDLLFSRDLINSPSVIVELDGNGKINQITSVRLF
jgi:hypothetical protein